MTDVTCYHEAGHAVAAYLLGGIPERLILGQDDEDVLPEHFGQCRVAWPEIRLDQGSTNGPGPHGPDSKRLDRQRPDPRLLDRRHRELLTLVAGLVAEKIYENLDFGVDHLIAASHDLSAALQISREIGGDTECAARRVRAAVASVEQVLRRDAIWAAVAALADELDAHEMLEESQIAEVLDFWLSRIA